MHSMQIYFVFSRTMAASKNRAPKYDCENEVQTEIKEGELSTDFVSVSY